MFAVTNAKNHAVTDRILAGLEASRFNPTSLSGLSVKGEYKLQRTTGIPVVTAIAGVVRAPQSGGAMKNIKRFCLGFLSSILLTAGFARAADRFDPLLRNAQLTDKVMAASPDSTNLCSYDESL